MLPEMTATHDVNLRARLALRYRHRKLKSFNSLVDTFFSLKNRCYSDVFPREICDSKHISLVISVPQTDITRVRSLILLAKTSVICVSIFKVYTCMILTVTEGCFFKFFYLLFFFYIKKCNGIRYTFSMNNANTGASIS